MSDSLAPRPDYFIHLPFRPAAMVITLTALLLSYWVEHVGKSRPDEVR
jgi:hypothetical protein